MAEIQVVRRGAYADTDQTPGMVREQAFAREGVWTGVVRAAPGTVSGWHHHGEHDTYVYVVAGKLRLESGPGGRDVVELGPGEFGLIPARTVHREGNPADRESELIGFRVGSGPVVVNVEGPEEA